MCEQYARGLLLVTNAVQETRQRDNRSMQIQRTAAAATAAATGSISISPHMMPRLRRFCDIRGIARLALLRAAFSRRVSAESSSPGTQIILFQWLFQKMQCQQQQNLCFCAPRFSTARTMSPSTAATCEVTARAPRRLCSHSSLASCSCSRSSSSC